jgi:tetratricopeptide (TPR) repeat protein
MKRKLNIIYFFITALLFVGCAKGKDPSPAILLQDFEARRQLKAEKYEEALQSYYNIVETNPNIAGTHSNIGVILNMVQKPEEALKSLEHALEVARQTHDLTAEFAVQFNLGAYYGGLKKVEEAIDHYQAALEIVPASIETKTNIELLIQQSQQGEKGEKSEKDQQNQNGNNNQNDNKNNQDKKDQKEQKKDQKDQDKKDDKKDGDKDKEQKPDEGQKRENSPKYKPRPFQGEELSEGDVKKILGELRNQEQKIRANFEKKEKGKTRRNEKDW